MQTLYENEAVQYFQNYEYYDNERTHFRKHFQRSTKFMKKRTLNGPCNFQKPFNFRLLLKLKLL